MDKPTLTYQFSGLIDTRNAYSARGQEYPNLDLLYGVFDSKQEAFVALSSPNDIGVNALVAGRTVGVRESGFIVEYWLEEEKDAEQYTEDDLVLKKAPSVVEIALEPSDNEEYSVMERNAMYRILSTAPRGSVFVGVDNDGHKYSLNVSDNPAFYIITYIDGSTVQRLDVDKDSHEITNSYVSYLQ